MRIVVTGAGGLLGSALTRRMAERHDVRAWTREDGDLRDPAVVQRLAALAPELVVHLAAVVGPASVDQDVDAAIASNVTATVHVARAAREAGARLAYASTGDVYGPGTSDGARREVDRPATPHRMYFLTKLWGEQAAAATAPEGLQVLRIANPYGSGTRPVAGRSALTNMMWQALHRKPVPVFRGVRRSFCHVNDVAEAMELVVLSGEQAQSQQHALDGGGVYNVGRDDDLRELAAIARLVCDIAGAPQSLIDLVDAPAGGDAPGVDTAKLFALGFRARVPLEHGLADLRGWVARFDEHGAPIRDGAGTGA